MEEILDTTLTVKPRKKTSGLKITGSIAKHAFLILLAVVLLFPVFVMVSMSFLPDSEINMGVIFSPTRTISFVAYQTILSGGSSYLKYLGNSLMVCSIMAVGIPIMSSLCAFGFSKIDFKGRDVYFGIVLATMMIPAVVTLVPLYVIYDKLGWIDHLYPMWVPSLFGGGATNIFLMRQFMRGIPNELMNAAKLDGANVLVIYFRIMLPLCIPIMLYVAVTSFMGAWNDFMTPYTYINRGKDHLYTLALGVYYDYGNNQYNNALTNYAYAAGVIMTVPCAILFFVFQKYLVEGVAGSGMKD